MNKFLLPIILIAVVVVIIFVGAGLRRPGAPQIPSQQPAETNQQPAFQQATETARPAPDFALEEFATGNTVKLSDFRGKPVVVNFWAAWCPFCLKELSDFKQAAQPYTDNLVILAVNRAEPRSTIAEYASELGIAGTNIRFLLDPEDRIYDLFGSVSMPVTFFIDKDGLIVDKKFGPLTPEEITNKFRALTY